MLSRETGGLFRSCEAHSRPACGSYLRPRCLNCPSELQLDRDRVVHFEQQGAGVLQPPLDKGNTELRAAAPMISRETDLRRHGQFVLAPVQEEDSVDLY